MADETRLSVKVWVDNEKKRVVFAEANRDFVDVLFSFLTLPLGTIVKLLSKKSGLGCIDNLYESVEQLGDHHFSTKACKNMLLTPRSAAEKNCEDLKLNLGDDPKPRRFYMCKMDDCISRSTCYYSSVRETSCNYCGMRMDKVKRWRKDATREGDGVFVKRNSAEFIITDDFRVTPSSVLQYYDILEEYGVKDIDLLEERTLEFGRKELLNLLKKFLIGKQVLTKIWFADLFIQCTTPIYNVGMEMKKIKSEGNTEFGTENLHVKLIMNRTNNNVVCAEVGEVFANQLFSFLTFPLGSVLKLIGCSYSLGCMTYLYKSIQGLKLDCFMSEKEKSMLISPQLAPFFRCNKQMLNIQELSPVVGKDENGCRKCYYDNLANENKPCSTIKCKHGVQQSNLIGLDPKLAKGDKYLGGGFVSEAKDFLVTNDLHVTPMSFLSFKKILQKEGLHVDQLEKREMTITTPQVVDLLRAMLISKTALSDALFPHGK